MKEENQNTHVQFYIKHRYQWIEETRIETASGGVCQALDENLGRTVLIKYVQIDSENKKQAMLKASSEVKAIIIASEEVPFVPKIFETFYDSKKSVYYIVMEYIRGNTLTKMIGNLNAKAFLKYMASLCGILKVLDKKKLYHKDIKPDNIMINDRNELYLIDFNISLSLPNLVEGTRHYKAPEMGKGSQYSGREKADMFSIGVMMYEYFTGVVPKIPEHYGRRRSLGPYQWDLFVEPITLNEQMDSDVNDIIVKCMKLNPKERYRNYGELQSALNKVQRGNMR